MDKRNIVYLGGLVRLLKPNETIIGAIYQTQLMRSSRALKEKRAITTPDTTKLFSYITMTAPCCSTGENIFENTHMENSIPSVLFTRLCFFWLLLFSIDGACPVWAALHIIWKYHKLVRFVDSFKRYGLHFKLQVSK